MAYICGCIPARIKHTLAELPETLDETYERTLREINKADWEFAHRLFQFVAAASRPLRIEELAELLAVDFKARPIPKFHKGWRVEDPVGAVMSTCSSLLTIVDGRSLQKRSLQETDGRTLSEAGYNGSRFRSGVGSDPRISFELYAQLPFVALFQGQSLPREAEDGYRLEKVIQFSHYSVKEFLTSDRLTKATDIIPGRYHFSMRSAHTLAAQACLGILLHLDEDVFTSDSLAKWPLAQYSARHWAYHARFEDVSQDVEDGMKQLFDPNKPHLEICFWMRKPDGSLLRKMRRSQGRLTLRGTHLHYATLSGFESIVEFLIIERSQDVNSRRFNGHVTPLCLASICGHVKAARKLIEHGADVTARFDDITLLHVVSNMEIARMLIERGADVKAQSKAGVTALHVALYQKKAEFARMLIDRGADVKAQAKDGVTPLYMALALGQVDIARMLIERGADVEAQNKNGETPLHLASSRGQVEVVRILIERDADATAQNMNGETPLYMALSRGQVDIARILIERGVDVAVQNDDGETPLHLASSLGQVDIARMLIESGADVAVQTEDGETPLHRASKWGRVEIVLMLIERGADVAAQSKNGNTPLHLVDVQSRPYDWSSSLDRAKISEILLKNGADVNARNTDGFTPIRLVTRWGTEEVKRVLLEHGADPGELERSLSVESGSTPISPIYGHEMPVFGTPVTSPIRTFADLSNASHSSMASTPNVAETDLPQTPSPLTQLPPNDILAVEPHCSPFFSTRRFLCSLGIVAIAVTLPFFIRSVPQTPAIG